MDKARFIELLKKADDLNKKRKDFFEENPEEYFELLSYGIILRSQFYYNQRQKYFSLIEDYRNGILDADLFPLAFFQMYRKDDKALEILKKDFQGLSNFSIDSKSEGFSSLISLIFEESDALAFDFDPQETYEITEKQFRDSIEEIFFQIQKYL